MYACFSMLLEQMHTLQLIFSLLKTYWCECMRDIFVWKNVLNSFKLGQLLYWKCKFGSLFSSANVKKYMNIWDRTNIYTMWNFKFKPCERYPKTKSKWVDPTVSKRKSRFSYKNKWVYTLTNLAYLISKEFHTSFNFWRVR